MMSLQQRLLGPMGADQHNFLFGCYTVLNGEVLALAWHRPWFRDLCASVALVVYVLFFITAAPFVSHRWPRLSRYVGHAMVIDTSAILGLKMTRVLSGGFGILIGAFVGYALVELLVLRQRIERLEQALLDRPSSGAQPDSEVRMLVVLSIAAEALAWRLGRESEDLLAILLGAFAGYGLCRLLMLRWTIQTLD
jgi:hypothetical protein